MFRKLLFSAFFIVVTAAWAMAEPATDIDRLRAALAHRPEDGTADTALIFTNVGQEGAKVRVHAFTRSGDPAGDADLEVAAKGLVYILASELHGDRPFLGHAEAVTVDRRVIASAVLVGGGTTDLPVVVRPFIVPRPTPIDPSARPEHYIKHIFPVVAAY